MCEKHTKNKISFLLIRQKKSLSVPFQQFSLLFYILYLKWDRNVWILLSTCLAHESEGVWKNFKYFLLFLSFCHLTWGRTQSWHKDPKTKKWEREGGSNTKKFDWNCWSYARAPSRNLDLGLYILMLKLFLSWSYCYPLLIDRKY